MHIVSVLGSPRYKGNCASIARRFCDTAQGLGATVTAYELNKLDYKGCQGCLACKESSEKCVVEDDLAQVLDSIHEADILVVASPVYVGEVSGQTKSFIDRMFSFLVPDFYTNPVKSRLNPGKKLVFILTQGDPDEKNFSDIFPMYQGFAEWLGFSDIVLIRGCGLEGPDDASAREDIMGLAQETARKTMA